MVWVDSPPLIRPGRGVQRGLRVEGPAFRVEWTLASAGLLYDVRRIRTLNPKPSTLNPAA